MLRGQDATPQHTVEHAARLEQIGERGKRPAARPLAGRLEIRPPGRDQRAAAVRQDEDQLEPTPTAHPADQLKRAARQWVTRPHDPHRLRETLEVGSVSCVPSTKSRTTRSSLNWSGGCAIGGC
jgi:hypothetical protein